MGKVKRLHNASDKNPVDKPPVVLDSNSINSRIKSFDASESVNAELQILRFIHSLGEENSLTGQIKVCHEFKARFKPTLMAVPLPKFTASNLVGLLLMYLTPQYAPLRSTLEWLVEASTQSVYQECLSSVNAACSLVLNDLSTILATEFKLLPLPFVRDCVSTLIQMAIIDKECRWLDTGDLFVQFLSTMQRLFSACTAALFPDDTSNAVSVLTDAGVAYAEHCAETMKSLTVTLKTRKDEVFYASIRSLAAVKTTEALLASAFVLLASDFISRDVITSVSIGVISLQYTLRFRDSPDAPLGPQLHALLRLASISEAGIDASSSQAAAIDAGIMSSLVVAVSVFPDASRCELCRACMSIYDSSLFTFCPQASASTDSALDDQLLFGYVYSMVISASSASLINLRFCGLQMMETWLSTVEQLESRGVIQDPREYCSSMQSKLATISRLLTMIWSHPSKLINHIVPVVYQRLVDFVAKSRLMRVTENGAILEETLKDLINEALRQPPNHRGRYQALNILLPKVSAELFITSQPSIIADLVKASSARDVSSAATKLLGTLLKYLRDREGYDETKLRALWSAEVVKAICSPSHKIRSAAIDYLIPEVLAVDNKCGPVLIDEIRRLDTAAATTEAKLCGIINVVLHCRLVNIVGQELAAAATPEVSSTLASQGPLTLLELQWGCVHNDVSIRLNALMTIVAAQKPSTPLVPAELHILMKYLPYSLKDSEADHRHRILRLVKTLVIRIKEALRVAQRDAKKLEEKRAALVAKGVSPTDLQAISSGDLPQLEVLTTTVFQWLGRVCMENSFPGASFDREIMTLDLLSCIIENAEVDMPQLSSLFTPALTSTILNMFLSNWDKSRHLAADISLKLPRPLPGYDTMESVDKLLAWARHLTGSARQRESDAGSQIIRVAYEIYCVHLSWDIRFLVTPGTSNAHTPGTTTATVFFADILDTVEDRIAKISVLFAHMDKLKDKPVDIGIDSSASAPLCHGLLLGKRYCTSSVIKCIRTAGGAELATWKQLLKRSLALSFLAMRVGTGVVAEAPSDVDFAPHLASSSSLGPVNANSYMFLNTNSFMGATSLEDTVEDEATSNKELQRAVVGAWLLVKESAAMLCRLIEISVKFQESESLASLLDVEDINSIGLTFVDALGRLKHMGAISEVHASLQKASESLLRYGYSNPELCSLPLNWLRVLLDKLESKQQVFILRRSSGFAYSFLSLLRAELSDAKPMLLSIAMKSLLKNAAEEVYSLAEIPSGVAEDNALEGATEGWRRSVHALNIIRLILLDGTLGPNLDPYISDATKLAVTGFKSKRWAIRNSSMMVFAAVVQRAVSNEKNDFANIHSSTANDFFNNFPDLFDFLLNELSSSVTGFVNLDIIYPLLLLLAKLRPDTISPDAANDGAPTFAYKLHEFLIPLELCSAMRTTHIRAMAAKALKSFIPLQNAPMYMLVVITNLHEQLKLAAIPLNEVHGELLQLLELLEALQANIAQLSVNAVVLAAVKTTVETQVLPSLEKFLLLFYTRVPFCPPVLVILLRIGIAAVVFIPTAFSKRLLWIHSSYCLDELFTKTADHSAAPYAPLLFKDCIRKLTELYFDEDLAGDAIVLIDKEMVTFDVLLRLLLHKTREIREGTLEGLLAVSTIKLQQKDREKLISTAFRCFANETCPPLLDLCLDLLCAVCKSVAMSDTSVSTRSQFSGLLQKLSSCMFRRDSSQAKSLTFTINGLEGEGAVELQNTDAAGKVFELLVWYLQYECSVQQFTGFLQIFQKVIDDDCPDYLRLAAATSWQALVLIARKFDSVAAPDMLLCRLWLLAVQLIEDDAEDVRDAICCSISSVDTETSEYPRDLEAVVAVAIQNIRTNLVAIIKQGVKAQSKEEFILVFEYYRTRIRTSGPAPLVPNDSMSRIFEEEQSNLYREDFQLFKMLAPVIAQGLALLLASNDAVVCSQGTATLEFILEAVDLHLEEYLSHRDQIICVGDGSFRSDIFNALFGSTLLLKEIYAINGRNYIGKPAGSVLIASIDTKQKVASATGTLHPLIVELLL